MAECDHNCANCSSKCEGAPKYFNLNEYSHIKHIVGVVSGKGGVGKSATTTLLACELAKEGYKVGILDADITGPSIPKSFGINSGLSGNQNLMFPQISKLGIKIVSINLLLEHQDDPVLWRGPVVGSAIKQFYEDVLWEDLDYLLIDMPPGTSDITLTVMQSFPITELIIVSTPQDMVSMIVKKVIAMANKMPVPIRGVVENMAYINCPGCDSKIKVFSKKSAEEHAEYLGVPLIGELPINIDYSVYLIVSLCAVIITFFASLYPSSQSAKLNIVESIRQD